MSLVAVVDIGKTNKKIALIESVNPEWLDLRSDWSSAVPDVDLVPSNLIRTS